MKKVLFLGGLVAAIALVVAGFAVAVAGAPSGDGVQPTEVAMQVSNACDGGQKLDGDADGGPTGDLDSGTYPFSFEGFPGTITITVRNTSAGKVFDYVTDHPTHLITSMYVKGGPTANFYNYLPTPGGQQADTGLHSPVNANNGKYYGLSHICVFLDKKGFA